VKKLNKKIVFATFIVLSAILVSNHVLAIPSIEISGVADYKAYSKGRINVFAKDDSGKPITGASGTTEIYSQDNEMIASGALKELTGGQYYVEFTVPDTGGVYSTLVNFQSSTGSAAGSFTFNVIPFDWFGAGVNVLWFVFIFASIFFGQRILIYQIIAKSEQFVATLDSMTVKGKNIVIRKITKKPTKELRQQVDGFLEFFTISPVNLDPYGILRKIEHLYNLSETRFKHFIKQIAPKADSESQANIMMGLSGAMSLNELTKIVRHYLELVKKTKSLQFAFLLQMQMPFAERIAKALLAGTEALSNGWPIGDSAGSMVAAKLIGDTKVKEIEEDVVMAKKRIKGKTVYVMKAKGPGGRLGKLGKAVEKMARGKIGKIITVDAAAKLEGEKTGSIAEGIGVAIGGIGVDRAQIENLAVSKGLPLDSIIIKMSAEESIQPMKAEILVAVDRVVKLVEDDIAATRQRGPIIMVGVGNTGGVGNNAKSVAEAEKTVRKILKIIKKKKKKKRFGIFDVEEQE